MHAEFLWPITHFGMQFKIIYSNCDLWCVTFCVPLGQNGFLNEWTQIWARSTMISQSIVELHIRMRVACISVRCVCVCVSAVVSAYMQNKWPSHANECSLKWHINYAVRSYLNCEMNSFGEYWLTCFVLLRLLNFFWSALFICLLPVFRDKKCVSIRKLKFYWWFLL